MMIKIFFISLLTLCFSPVSYADEAADQDSYREPPLREQANGSAASFDKRLPPVIPGEEIQDGNKKIKVWSTSGNVGASEPPRPPEFPHHDRTVKDQTGGAGVIVDGRGFVPSIAPQNNPHSK